MSFEFELDFSSFEVEKQPDYEIKTLEDPLSDDEYESPSDEIIVEESESEDDDERYDSEEEEDDEDDGWKNFITHEPISINDLKEKVNAIISKTGLCVGMVKSKNEIKIIRKLGKTLGWDEKNTKEIGNELALLKPVHKDTMGNYIQNEYTVVGFVVLDKKGYSINIAVDEDLIERVNDKARDFFADLYEKFRMSSIGDIKITANVKLPHARVLIKSAKAPVIKIKPISLKAIESIDEKVPDNVRAKVKGAVIQELKEENGDVEIKEIDNNKIVSVAQSENISEKYWKAKTDRKNKSIAKHALKLTNVLTRKLYNYQLTEALFFTGNKKNTILTKSYYRVLEDVYNPHKMGNFYFIMLEKASEKVAQYVTSDDELKLPPLCNKETLAASPLTINPIKNPLAPVPICPDGYSCVGFKRHVYESLGKLVPTVYEDAPICHKMHVDNSPFYMDGKKYIQCCLKGCEHKSKDHYLPNDDASFNVIHMPKQDDECNCTAMYCIDCITIGCAKKHTNKSTVINSSMIRRAFKLAIDNPTYWPIDHTSVATVGFDILNLQTHRKETFANVFKYAGLVKKR